MSEFDPYEVKTFKAKKCKCGFVNTHTNVRCEACGESLKSVRVIIIRDKRGASFRRASNVSS